MDVSAFTPGSALVVVVLIALAPFFAVMVTSFTKIVVVLSGGPANILTVVGEPTTCTPSMRTCTGTPLHIW